MTLRVAIVGTGRRGQLYLAHLLRRGDVAIRAVCDVNHRAAAAAGHMSRVSRARVYTRYELVLLHEDLDALIVASPARYHLLIAGEAVQRGLQVFLAPPLAATIPAGRRLAGQAGASCALDYAVRYEPDLPAVRALLAARPITRMAGQYRLPGNEINPARSARSSEPPPSPSPELLDTWELLAGRVRVVEPAPSERRGPALRLSGGVAGVVTGTMSLPTPWELVVEAPPVKVTITPAALRVAAAASVRCYTLDPMRALDTFLEAAARRDGTLIRTAPDAMLRPLALALAAREVLEQPQTLAIADVLAREEPPPRRWLWRQLARWLDFLWH